MAQVPTPVRAIPANINVAVNGIGYEALIGLFAKYASARVMEDLRAQGVEGILDDPASVYATLYETLLSNGMMLLFAGKTVVPYGGYLAPLIQEISLNTYPAGHPYVQIDASGLSLRDACRVFSNKENLQDVLTRNASAITM